MNKHKILTDQDMNVPAMTARMEALEARDLYEHEAITDTPVSTSLPTFLITLGVAAPTKAGIEAELNALKAKDNQILGVLRGAGLVAEAA